MISTAEFIQASQWAGIATLGFAAIAVLGFVLKWGIRFRLVGVTGFMGVLTAGLFALGLGLFTRSVIPGAVHYSLIYDNGASLAAIAVPANITETELDATLRQAAADLFSYGRLGQPGSELTIRARAIIHPKPGVSQPVYLGEIKQNIGSGSNQDLAIKIYPESFAQLPKPTA